VAAPKTVEAQGIDPGHTVNMETLEECVGDTSHFIESFHVPL